MGLAGFGRITSPREIRLFLTAALAAVALAGALPWGVPVAAALFPSATSEVGSAGHRLQPIFEENRGHAGAEAAFVARGAGQTVYLMPKAVEIRQGGETVRMEFLDGNGDASIVGQDLLQTRVNSYVGERKHWAEGVPTFASVRYEELYPGIDLLFHGRPGEIEYDFEISPGANPSAIQIRIAEGTLALHEGDLVIQKGTVSLRQEAPVSFQMDGGVRRPVRSSFEITDARTVGFSIGAYDRRAPLTIDPVWEFSSLIGGSGIETGQGLDVDDDGFIYLAGETESHDFPTGCQPEPCAPYQAHSNGAMEIFVMKLDPTGTQLLYSTYMGGRGWDGVLRNSGLAADDEGAAYITGITFSPDFPVTRASESSSTGAWDTTFDGPQDGFVAKFDSNGRLKYSTFIGGSGGTLDGARSIAVDRAGNAYMAGLTTTKNFPLKDALDSTAEGNIEGWVAKLDPEGRHLLFSTYLGGTETFKEEVQDVVLTPNGDLAVPLMTDAPNDVLSTNGHKNPGNRSILAMVIDPDRPMIKWSRWLGDSTHESDVTLMSAATAVDQSGSVYVGTTTNAQPPNGDLLFAKYERDGDLVYEKTVAGSSADRLNDMVVDRHGSVYAVGKTLSPDLFGGAPIVPGLEGRGGADGFAFKLAPDGARIEFGAYLGGPAPADAFPVVNDSLATEEVAVVAALGRFGALYVTGVASSPEFPTTDGSKVNGAWDTYILKIAPDEDRHDSPSNQIRRAEAWGAQALGRGR